MADHQKPHTSGTAVGEPYKANLQEKFGAFSDLWSPRIVAHVNDVHLKIARVEGEFIWHRHEHEDELFLVVEGQLELHFRDRVIHLSAGELCMVPRGVEHKPVAREETKVLLLEPASTRNTGDQASDRFVDPSWI